MGFRNPRFWFTCTLPALAAIALVCGSRVALALDPHKNLTQYVHSVWQTEQGLAQHSVETIAQTPDGYLWLGTQDGLVRFDGAQFTVFNEQNCAWIPHNFINALVV